MTKASQHHSRSRVVPERVYRVTLNVTGLDRRDPLSVTKGAVPLGEWSADTGLWYHTVSLYSPGSVTPSPSNLSQSFTSNDCAGSNVMKASLAKGGRSQ